MHCQATCTIDADKELVLTALEQQLRRITNDVERDGDSLVLLGLGPSPRAVNRRNRAVFFLESASGGTTVTADATFQASSLVTPEGQEDLVHEKLLRILTATQQAIAENIRQQQNQRDQEAQRDADETAQRKAMAAAARREAQLQREAEAQFEIEAREREARIASQREARAQVQREAEAARHHEASADVGLREFQQAIAQRDEAGTVQQSEDIPQPGIHEVPALIPPAEQFSENGRTALSEAERSAALARRHEAEKRLANFREREAQRVEEERAVNARALNAATTARQKHDDESYSEDVRRSDTTDWEASLPRVAAPRPPWIRWAVLAAILLAAVPIGVHYYNAIDDGTATGSSSADNSAPLDGTSRTSTADSPESALRVWELALRSRDAASQTGLYANPVDNYMGQRNLTHQQLAALKQSEISRRRGLWTIKFENVRITRKDDTATVNLTKHIMEEPPSKPVKESMVPSQLTLKNSGGMWWIVSENDAAPAQSAAQPSAPTQSAPKHSSRRRRSR